MYGETTCSAGLFPLHIEHRYYTQLAASVSQSGSHRAKRCTTPRGYRALVLLGGRNREDGMGDKTKKKILNARKGSWPRCDAVGGRIPNAHPDSGRERGLTGKGNPTTFQEPGVGSHGAAASATVRRGNRAAANTSGQCVRKGWSKERPELSRAWPATRGRLWQHRSRHPRPWSPWRRLYVMK